RLEIDFTEMEFILTLGSLKTLEHGVDLFGRHVGRRLNIARQQTVPGEFAADLLLDSAGGRSLGLQIFGELLGRLLEARSERGELLIDQILVDRNLGLTRGLYLQFFIDEIAEDLLAQP